MASRNSKAGSGRPKSTAPRARAAPARRRARRGAARPRGRPIRRTLYWAFVVLLWVGFFGAALLAYFAYDLPPVDGPGQVRRSPGVAVVSADGTLLATRGDLYGLPVSLAELPPYLPQAVIATEDRRFYRHMGVDPLGILRAASANLRAGHIVQGGSTISQQLAKNLFLSHERSWRRKVQEVLLALWLEARLSKDEILTLYLNRVYLGAGTYGVEAAAQRYFGKPARTVSLAEAAILTGLLKAPSRYAPSSNPAGAAKRAAEVLDNMVEAGFLTPARAAAVDLDAVRVAGRAPSREVNYFVDWVVEELTTRIGQSARDLVVVTTLDRAAQAAAERALAAALKDMPAAQQMALVALAPDGAVRAMIGGRSYSASQFNRATQARRQPGSAFKPFAYLAALERGMTPDSVMRDSPVMFGDWQPANFGGGHAGAVTLRTAMARSLNTVAVKVSEGAGRSRVIETAHRLGIASEIKPHPSLALGTSEVTLLELTAAYAPFANGGHRAPPYGIREIRTSEGEVLYRHEAARERVVAPLQVGQMNAMLREVMVSGTGKAASLSGRPAAGKTGTSQNGRDALFVGYTPDLVAGVWMGRDDARPMKGVTGGGAPARLWRTFMTAALEDVPPRPLPIAPPAPPRPRPQREAPEDGGGGGAFEGVIARLKDMFGGDAAVVPAAVPAAGQSDASPPFERRAAPERIRDWQKSRREQFR